jgi:hypothetical protein
MKMHTGLAAAGLLALSACGGEKTQTVSTADGGTATVTADRDGETATIEAKGDDGSTSTMVAGTGAKWPDDAPAYAAAYPGAALQMAMSGSSADGAGTFLNFSTSDAPSKVIDFYKAQAKAAGLGNETNVDTQGMRMFAATSPEGRTLSVQATAENGVTNVALSYASKPG